LVGDVAAGVDFEVAERVFDGVADAAGGFGAHGDFLRQRAAGINLAVEVKERAQRHELNRDEERGECAHRWPSRK
jgi:hypothetical protein